MVFLMYHELESPGRPLCQNAAVYKRYVVSAGDFRAQMRSLKDMGWRGVSVGDALEFPAKTVGITFDDGCETDFLTAAPILEEFGFGATFYITTNFLGKSGQLSPLQLRNLASSSSGFEIGSHSRTHAYLSDLDGEGLRREIVESKTELEQIVGKPIFHFSCPGGRYNRESVKVAKAAGYTTLATSRVGENFPETDRFSLSRIAITRNQKLEDFKMHCQGNGLSQLSLHNFIGRTAKRALGNKFYDYLRNRWLDT